MKVHSIRAALHSAAASSLSHHPSLREYQIFRRPSRSTFQCAASISLPIGPNTRITICFPWRTIFAGVE